MLNTLSDIGLDAHPNEPLHNKGFYRLGGAAEAFVVLETHRQLVDLMATGLPVTIVGRGSNLLIADEGIPGVVAVLRGVFRQRSVDNGILTAGAGVLNVALLGWLSRQTLGGLGCLAGVPGTVGGAVRMNAGWSVGEIADGLLDVGVVLPGGEAVTLTAAEMGFSYRRAAGLPPGSVITQARMSLLVDPTAVADEQQRVARHLARRKATQPLDRPSCGSVFQNPPGDHAGRLIEAVGLKGHAIGGAQISALHANFIVNNGGRAADVYALIRLARRVVWQQHGVLLEPEVHAVGAWPDALWPLPHPRHDA